MVRLRSWLRGSISCKSPNGAKDGAWCTLCSLRIRNGGRQNGLASCLAACFYSCLSPTTSPKASWRPRRRRGPLVQVLQGQEAGGRTGSAQGVSLLGGPHTLSHGNRHNNILSQPICTNPSILILTFPYTRPHVHTCTYILIHKHARVKPDLQNASVRALAFTHMTTDTTPTPPCTSKQPMFM